MYIFEKITEEHIQEIRDIYIYYINNSTATFHKHEVSMDEMRKIVLFDNPKYESYVIKEGEDICGYTILAQYKVREAFDYTAEVTIYLKNGYERKGIGRLALEFIEDRAKTKDIHMLISLVCGENKGSLSLFKSKGYEVCGHYKEVGYKFNRWLDLISLQKKLK